jgi:hypothetical protein
MRDFLLDYLQPRGLTRVPPESMISLWRDWVCAHRGGAGGGAASHDPAMVLAYRDKQGKFQGVHATYLNNNLTGKREREPQRQSYGLVKGNFIELEKIDYQKPLPKLIVGEGVETVEAATQLTELLGQRVMGVAVGGKFNFAYVDLPPANEYIVLVDQDDDGGSRKESGKLAQRLVGVVVRIATPDRPEGGKKGYDWNDALLDAAGDQDKAKELARTILEAAKFDTIMTSEEKRELRINALVQLKLEDPLVYEAEERDKAHRDLHIRLSVLDEEVERRCQRLREEREKAAPPPVNMELLAASARDIIACEDVLELFAEEAGRIIAGEELVLKLLYLAATTRLFDKAMHLALKGASAIGKSQARKAVLEYFPPESVINFTTVSEKALLYWDDDFRHKILSMGEAHGREESDLQNYLLRELMSEGVLRYPVSQKVGGRIVTVTIEKHGPVAFIVTTTRNQLDPENETRMLSLELDDSEEQTRAVVERVAVIEGLNRRAKANLKPWQDYQRWLATGETRVKVPFALTLARLIKDTKSVRLRRDMGQLLRAVKAHALLHREHRNRNEDGEIIATLTDYTAVRKVLADLLAASVELRVRQRDEETVKAVQQIFAAPWAGDNDRDAKGATVSEVAEKLKLDRTATWRRLQSAEHAGLIVNVEDRKGKPGRYRLTAERPTNVETSSLLPTTAELKSAVQAARERRRQQTESAEYPRKTVQPRNRRS